MPIGVVVSMGPLEERTYGFSCVQPSMSSSDAERGRCLAATVLLRLFLLRQKKNNASNAANASAPKVHPRTIGRMLELPPLLLAVGDVVAPCAAADELCEPVEDALEVPEEVLDLFEEVDEADVLEVDETVDRLDVAAALAEDDELDVSVVLEDDVVLEVVVALELLVAELGLPSAEVTSVKIEPASDRSELNKFPCAATVVASKATTAGL